MTRIMQDSTAVVCSPARMFEPYSALCIYGLRQSGKRLGSPVPKYNNTLAVNPLAELFLRP